MHKPAESIKDRKKFHFMEWSSFMKIFLLSCCLTLVVLLSFSQQALAQTCVDDVTGVTNVCTANDVNLGLLVVIDEIDGCDFPGDTAQVKLQAQLNATSAERYDIGLFIALDGGDARTGSCYQDFLPPPLFPNNSPTCDGTCSISGTSCFKDADCPAGETCAGGYDPGSSGLGNGEGPFYDAECLEDPGDLCGDLEQGVDTFFDLGFRDGVSGPVELTVPCIDNDGDGFVDVGTCVSWDNGKSNGGNKPSCLDEADAVPNTKAKCKCESLNIINLNVPKTIEVIKVIDPIDDSGLFNLEIDSVTELTDASHNDTTGKKEVTVGTHTVGESAGTGTNLAFYTTSISCEDRVGRCNADSTIHCVNDAICDLENSGDTCDLTPTPVGSCSNCTSLDVDIPQEQSDIVCTITNVLNISPPDLTVQKDNDANEDSVFSDTETYPGTTSGDFPTTIDYQVSITNNSSSDATIPVGGITDDTHDISGLVCTRADSSTFSLGDLPVPIAAGETITCTFDVTFDNADDSSVTNTFEVTATNDAGSDTASRTLRSRSSRQPHRRPMIT
jgi:hypothetical protein